MAQQLKDRLNPFFTDRPYRNVLVPGDVPAGIGTPIRDVKTLIVHETTGWPTRDRAESMFYEAFNIGPGHEHKGRTTQLVVAGDGTVMQGMNLPGSTQHAGFTNGWSLGMETGHPWGNYGGNDHLGPFCSTDAAGAASSPPVPMPDNFWVSLSGDGSIDDAGDDDIPGLKLFLRHHHLGEVIIQWWTTARYTGPWRQPVRVPEAIFNEAQYRSWALVARWLAEEHLFPRNFPLLPAKTRGKGDGDTADHSTLHDAVTFSSIVLADEALSRAPATWSLPATPVPPTAATLQAKYTGPGAVVAAGGNRQKNVHWQAMFNVFRGIHGHGFCGDPANGDHDCPGPMFDWHRFAREVWDWWWWPFDFDTANPTVAVGAREYSLASRDATTPLKDHYWPTPVATPQGRVRPGIHGAHGSPQTFELPAGSRVYAMANGELVAARLPTETAGQASLAFALVRHEVFHQLDTRTPAAATATKPPIFANRIDYDVAPTTVYSLYMHLARPAGIDLTKVAAGNPDWLNRVLMRKKECELGIGFHDSPAGRAVDASIWNDRPPGGSGRRLSLYAQWVEDNTALDAFLTSLRAGNLAVAPQSGASTPIRILLGDFLAGAGLINRDGRRGVRVEVFSNTLISPADFVFSEGSDWTPPSVTNQPAIRYQSEWARTPTGAELAAVQAAGADPALVNWWGDVQPSTLQMRLPTDAYLDEHGMVIHYDPLSFMPWLNTRTWRSEWPKYRITNPATAPDSPIIRA